MRNDSASPLVNRLLSSSMVTAFILLPGLTGVTHGQGLDDVPCSPGSIKPSNLNIITYTRQIPVGTETRIQVRFRYPHQDGQLLEQSSTRVLWSGVVANNLILPAQLMDCVHDSANATCNVETTIPSSFVTQTQEAALNIFAHFCSGGSITSNPVIIGVVTPSLFFPRLVSSNGTSPDDSQYTGVAVVNLHDTTSANLTFTAYDRLGQPISAANVTNPVSRTLPARQQLALVDTQLFGPGLSDRNTVGWLKLESTLSKVVGFFLWFNNTLTILDGADVSSSAENSFVLPEIEGAEGFTEIHVANPNPSTTTITLELVGADGTLRRDPVTRNVNGSGVLAQGFGELFPGATPNPSDYIRVTSTQYVAAFESLGKAGGYAKGLNGQNASAGATLLYSPQYVIGGPWRSTLSVINLDPTPGTVTFAFISDNGTPIGSPKVVSISAKGKIYISDQAFFVNAGNAVTQGYVRISSSVLRLAGSVVFGDPAQNTFAAVLPLVSTLQTGIVFSQLASNQTYFTGVAILNPNDIVANATIEVRDESGNVIATKVEIIPASQRKSMLLTQYFPQLVGQNRQKGYIRISVDRAVASFALYGTNTSPLVLSAVPPQPMP